MPEAMTVGEVRRLKANDRGTGGTVMCQWGKRTAVRVKIPADLSSTGAEKWRDCGIDSCIAPIVKALQEGGIDMRGSCCGHGYGVGDVHLQDGRMLLVLTRDLANAHLKGHDVRIPGLYKGAGGPIIIYRKEQADGQET